MSVLRYFHTIRHLRPVQIYGRLLSRIPLPSFNRSNPPRRQVPEEWIAPARRHASLVAPTRFRFLNDEREVAGALDWDPPSLAKLWLYNLHYFDDLNAQGSDGRTAWHRALLERWIVENLRGIGVGWEPYPTSLRVVNWIKWLLSGNEPGDRLLQSLAVQSRHLAQRVEIHLLGNHIFANAKALLFAGFFFKGREADRWRERGAAILRREIEEQILPDGGHFERSPMYHSVVLEDILDCINLMKTYRADDGELAERMSRKASSMLVFLKDIVHPDGELPFFNDTAIAISPPPRELIAYAERLGLRAPGPAADRLIAKPDFGLWVLNGDDERMIADAGWIGPDYLPAHAHCDTLSYELSLAGTRFIVNSGVYAYQGPDRHFFRSTAAHNTVRIDGEEQHEIWAAFRVARRGYPVGVLAEESEGSIRFLAAHNGYQRLRGKPLHTRTITYRDKIWTIEDRIDGHGSHRAEGYIHLHPDVVITDSRDTSMDCLVGSSAVRIRLTSGDRLVIDKGWYSPEFGLRFENPVLVIRKEGPLPLSLGYCIQRVR